ncbi:MAG: mycothiol synthase [Nakamurella sp.]
MTAGRSGIEPTPTGWRSTADGPSAAQIRHLVEQAAATDGTPAVSGHVLDSIDSGGACVAYLLDPELAGVAVRNGDDPAEVVVDPTQRGRGFGTALVRLAVQSQGAVWAYGDLPAAAAVAGRLGLERGRVLLQMRRTTGADDSSDDGSAPALPAEVRIRTFVPGQDEDAFLGVNARAFAWHPEQGRLDLAGLTAEMAQDWFDPAGFFLAVTHDPTTATGDRVLGFHWTKVHTDVPGLAGPAGEIYVLGVDPAAGVRGLGGPLTSVGLDYLHRRGLDTVLLYVEGDNDRAVRLYQRFGFSTFLTNVVYQRPAADGT